MFGVDWNLDEQLLDCESDCEVRGSVVKVEGGQLTRVGSDWARVFVTSVLKWDRMRYRC